MTRQGKILARDIERYLALVALIRAECCPEFAREDHGPAIRPDPCSACLRYHA